MSAVQSTSYPAASSALRDASETARQILGSPGKTSSSSAVHHHYHDHWGHWGWGPSWGWYPAPYYTARDSSSSGDNDYTWVAIPAAAVGLGVAYFLGQNYSQR